MVLTNSKEVSNEILEKYINSSDVSPAGGRRSTGASCTGGRRGWPKRPDTARDTGCRSKDRFAFGSGNTSPTSWTYPGYNNAGRAAGVNRRQVWSCKGGITGKCNPSPTASITARDRGGEHYPPLDHQCNISNGLRSEDS
ncbi:MAG: hypothetical protein DDT29_00939 [Dehalococcoidia bacterium]|nr:hypothetical protein [Bacillota bacterium]